MGVSLTQVNGYDMLWTNLLEFQTANFTYPHTL
jgi:hypothetical protein